MVAGVDHGGGIDEDCRRSLPRRFLLRIFLQRGQYHAVDRSESGAMQWTEAPNSNPRCSLQCLEGTPWVVGRKNGRHRPKWPSWWGRETLPILRRTCVGLSTRIIFCCSSDATGKKLHVIDITCYSCVACGKLYKNFVYYCLPTFYDIPQDNSILPPPIAIDKVMHYLSPRLTTSEEVLSTRPDSCYREILAWNLIGFPSDPLPVLHTF